MSAFIQLIITTATRDEALRMARTLVEQRLAACGQVSGPITSIYPWQGVIETTEEWRCTLKTRAALFAAVATAIRALHSYAVPQIISTPLDAISADYQAWLDAALQ